MWFVIEIFYDVDVIDMGVFIVCLGVCLIVVEKGFGWFVVDVLEEFLDCFIFSCLLDGNKVLGVKINLEWFFCVGDEMGGYIVSGYVDGVGNIVEIEEIGDLKCFLFEIFDDLLFFVVEKGFVVVDGILLIVNWIIDCGFEVNIIFYI